MKIIVESEEIKQKLLAESEYIHDTVFVVGDDVYGLDSDKAGMLMHIYMNPDMIIVKDESYDFKSKNTLRFINQ